MKNSKILQRKYFYDFVKYDNVAIVTDNKLQDSVFQIVLETFTENSTLRTDFVYEFDLNLIVRKTLLSIITITVHIIDGFQEERMDLMTLL